MPPKESGSLMDNMNSKKEKAKMDEVAFNVIEKKYHQKKANLM